MCKMKEWMETLTDVVSMTKKEYVLTITSSLLGGIILGFMLAPKRTRHTTIGSNNGPKNSGNEYGSDFFEDYGEDDWEDMEKLEDVDDVPLPFN